MIGLESGLDGLVVDGLDEDGVSRLEFLEFIKIFLELLLLLGYFGDVIVNFSLIVIFLLMNGVFN